MNVFCLFRTLDQITDKDHQSDEGDAVRSEGAGGDALDEGELKAVPR